MLVKVTHNQAVWETTTFYVEAPIGMEDVPAIEDWVSENINTLLGEALDSDTATIESGDTVGGFDVEVGVEVLP